jgi:hypothetical protein
MKTRFNIKFIYPLLYAVVLATSLLSCKKDSDGSPDMKPGNPVFGAISPGEAAGNEVVTLTGSGLGQIRSIVFDNNNVPATFQPNLNTENAIIFRVPDTAFGGQQNIVFTNSEGKTLLVPFKVIALPTVATISTTDFEPGTEVTITGNNLSDVTSVVIEGTNDQATIVSTERKKLVITMPASTVNRAKLKITNSSGERLTDQELTNMNNALKFFTEGFDAGMQDWSWSNEHTVSSTEAFMGTKSLRALFGGGTYGAISIHYDFNIPFADYTYVTFWAKGGTADMQLTVWPDGDNSKAKALTIPANVWTYFKVPLQDFRNVTSQRLNLQGMAPVANQTILFDNILFVK